MEDKKININQKIFKMKNIVFLFSFVLMIGLLSAGSITGTVFDGETGLEIQDVQVVTTGDMDTCTINIYVNGTLDLTTSPLPRGTYDNPLSGGSVFRSIRVILPGALGIFQIEHPIDGSFDLLVNVGSNTTRTFSDGTVITIQLIDSSVQQATASILTDTTGKFTIYGLSDDTFDLQLSKIGYDTFEFGPILIDNSNPLRTDRNIPDGMLFLFPNGSGPSQLEGSIAGYVEDTTGIAIEDVTVEVYFDGNLIQTIQTDATGFFNATGLEYSGQYTLEFIHPDYLQDTRIINLDLSTNRNMLIPVPIQLVYIGNTENLHGYVIETGTGDPIPNALVRIPFFGLSDLTDNNGFYNILNVPINFPVEVTVTAIGYYNGGINPLTVPIGGREHNFTLTLDPSYVSGNGTLTGYVFDNNNNPLRSVKVEIAGIFNTTDTNGQYIINNIPEGYNQRVTVSRSGYTSRSLNLNIFKNEITTQNFILQRDDSDSGGGSSGSSSSSTSPPSSSAQSITPPHTSLSTLYVNGCPIRINRDINREKDKTAVTIELINICDEDVEQIELREYPPEEAVLAKITYSTEPKKVYLQPLVIIWEIDEIRSGEKMEFVYYINKQIESNDFEAKIFSLTDDNTEQVQKVELLVSKSVFVGDNVTLILTNEKDMPLSNREITIISPFGKELIVITDENGKAYFNPDMVGVYEYGVKDAIILNSVSTKVSEMYMPDEIIKQKVEVVDDDENKVLSLGAFFGDIGKNWPAILGLGIAVLAILTIVVYFTSKHSKDDFNEDKPTGYSELYLEEEQKPIFEEINKRQIQGDEKTILEEIKRREIKPEKNPSKLRSNTKKEIQKRKVKDSPKSKAKKTKRK